MAEAPGPQEHSPSRHETRDLSARAVVLFLAGLFVLIVATLWGMKGLVSYYTSHEPVVGPPPSPVATSGQWPPEPRLQIAPAQDLKAKRAAEDGLLNNYGWVDRQNGIVRIPVERAIELLAERGLPARVGVVPRARPQQAQKKTGGPPQAGTTDGLEK